MRLRTFLLLGLPLTLVAAAPFGYGLTTTPPPKQKPVKLADTRKAAEKLCASRSVNERLKARIFDDAATAGAGASGNLNLLASFSEVRMDQPLLKSQDEELGVTVCTGRFVLLLPPGSEQRFGGRTLLQADVEYAAQSAADGSGLVYQLRGADSIVYRLAAYNLKPDHALQVTAAELAAQRAAPPLPAPVEVLPTAIKIQAMPVPEEILPIRQAEAPPPPAPVAVAKVERRQAEPAKPVVKLAKAKRPEADKKPVKLAKAEPKPDEAKKAAKKEVRIAAKAEKDAAKSKRIALAEARKAEAAKGAKAAKERKTALAAAEKAEKARKLAAASAVKREAERKLAAAALKKEVERKLAKADLAKAKAKQQQLAAAKKPPAVKEKPRQVAVAKAVPKQPQRDGTANSFLAYEQRKASVPAAIPASAPAPRPVAARDSCDDAGSSEARLICANPNLRAKQRYVNNSYFSALEDADGETRRALTGSRSRFAAYLQRCSTATCLASAYEDRLAEIRDIMNHY